MFCSSTLSDLMALICLLNLSGASISLADQDFCKYVYNYYVIISVTHE